MIINALKFILIQQVFILLFILLLYLSYFAFLPFYAMLILPIFMGSGFYLTLALRKTNFHVFWNKASLIKAVRFIAYYFGAFHVLFLLNFSILDFDLMFPFGGLFILYNLIALEKIYKYKFKDKSFFYLPLLACVLTGLVFDVNLFPSLNKLENHEIIDLYLKISIWQLFACFSILGVIKNDKISDKQINH